VCACVCVSFALSAPANIKSVDLLGLETSFHRGNDQREAKATREGAGAGACGMGHREGEGSGLLGLILSGIPRIC